MFAAIELGEHLVLLADARAAWPCRLVMSEAMELIERQTTKLALLLYLLLPQVVDHVGELAQALDLVGTVGLRKALPPAVDISDGLRFQTFDDLVPVVGHARVAYQEVVDAMAL